MNNEVLKTIKNKVSALPSEPGVYLMKDQYGNVIYIGKAKNLKNRVSSYFIKTNYEEKVIQMVARVNSFDYIITNSEYDALNLESNLIKKHQPFFNILLKDGKANAFIKINLNKPYPVLEITRIIKKDGAKYFGPYFNGVRVRDLLKIINHTFMLRDCKLNIKEGKVYKRECLNYFLGICSAPCTNRINHQDYLKQVHSVIDFLNGDLETARKILTEKMQINVNNENFERAIEYRESLELLKNLKKKVITELKKDVDIDVFGFSTNGYYSVVSTLVIRAGKMIGVNNYFVLDSSLKNSETVSNFMLQYYPHNSSIPEEIITKYNVGSDVMKWLTENKNGAVKIISPKIGVKKQLLEMANKNAKEYLEKNIEKNKLEWIKTIKSMEQLQSELNLSTLPVKMECYDIANNQGTDIVAGMTVFYNGKPKKEYYRKFKIKSVAGKNDDFESIREVIARRIQNLNSNDESFSNLPNLIVIDGGLGQLNCAVSVLKQYGINVDIISLAKKEEEIFIPNIKQSIKLSKNNIGLKLLQNIRDEAHRFANTFHRRLKEKNMIKSELENISGVGEITIKNLMAHFKDINLIKTASAEDLIKVKGIKLTTADNIVNYFKNKK